MGFRSRVRQYVRSLTARRRSQTAVNFSIPAPPPSTTPGTALSPISEESSHLRTVDSENYSRSTLDREQPRISILNDDPPTLTTISFNADALTRSSPGPEGLPPNSQSHRFTRRTTPDPTNPNVRTNQTGAQSSTQTQTRGHPNNNDDTVQSSSVPVPSTPALYGDQYTPLGPSKCFIIPAGKDDYLVRILHHVRLGGVDSKGSTRPDEIKISAPNAYYSPKIGHCVLLQCGDEQWIARVLIRIPAEERGGGEGRNRVLDVNPNEERNGVRILGEEVVSLSTTRHPNPNAAVSEFGSPNMSLNDITILHTPARVRVSRERGDRSRAYSLDSSTDYSHSGNLSTVPAPPASTPVETPIHGRRYLESAMSREENQNLGNQNQNSARPHSQVGSSFFIFMRNVEVSSTSGQVISERQRGNESTSVHLEAGQRPQSNMARQSFENVRRRNSQHSQHSQADTAQTDPDINGPEPIGSSLSDLRDLPAFGTPYVPPSGESSGWNTPNPLPHSPPRHTNRTLWPRRTYLPGWGQPPYAGDSSTDSLATPMSDAERERERQRQQQQQQQPMYLFPLPPGGSQILPYPPGFAPYHQLPPQYRTPTRAPDGVWFYTDSVGYPQAPPPTGLQPSPYVRFSDKATLRQEVGSEMREIPLVSVADGGHGASSSSPSQSHSVPASVLRRHSNTIALPPSPSSPESNSDSETSPEPRAGR
ncbi:hypothetical protein L218DRAFT_999328 [Marasmius fiardii PR-910]|nr:hypothetical protein L218DRAFT_999328 [Marasmius fiardii PR-910]